MLPKIKLPVQKCVYTTPLESKPHQKNMMMWVRIEDLPDDFPLDPNARRADVDSRVAKQIMATLRETPEDFWKLNGGIQMTAQDFEVKDGRHVTLTMFDPQDANEISDGVINGGHTYACIKTVKQDLQTQANTPKENKKRDDAKRRLAALNEAIVRIEVLTGIEHAELPGISRARNTGEAVKKFSLQNLKGLYQPIKEILGQEECKRVGFSENDLDVVPGTKYQVTDLIRLMCLFNDGLYPHKEDKHPVVCYTSAGHLVDKWEGEKESKTFHPLIPRLKDFMRLHDEVYILLDNWKGSLKGAHNAFEKENKDGYDLLFTNTKTKRKISTAFVYPLLASLRILLDEKGEWRAEPLKFLSSSGQKLIEALALFYKEQCKSKPHELGRSIGSWRVVMAESRAHFAEERLAAANSNTNSKATEVLVLERSPQSTPRRKLAQWQKKKPEPTKTEETT
jgi:hypothetical protein